MLTRDEARDMVDARLRRIGDGYHLLPDPVHEGDYGWVFSWKLTENFQPKAKFQSLKKKTADNWGDHKGLRLSSVGFDFPLVPVPKSKRRWAGLPGAFLVDKHNAKLHDLSARHTIEFYVENFLATGDPYRVPVR